MNDIIYFDFTENESIDTVGVITNVPRKGWRHRYGKIRMVIANEIR